MKKLKIGDCVDPEKLLGCEASLMLHVGNVNEFRLGQIVFEVTENESDGYRSSMEELVIKSLGLKKPSTKLDTVTLIVENYIYSLKSVLDNHIWLRFGTDNTDSYYPSFVFDWTPRISESDKELLKLELLKLIK